MLQLSVFNHAGTWSKRPLCRAEVDEFEWGVLLLQREPVEGRRLRRTRVGRPASSTRTDQAGGELTVRFPDASNVCDG
jgi:hypothetical protein